MIDRTGTRIVPAFIMKKQGLSGFISQPKVFIGFEVNRKEIAKLLNIENTSETES